MSRFIDRYRRHEAAICIKPAETLIGRQQDSVNSRPDLAAANDYSFQDLSNFAEMDTTRSG
jgi:hypothetical protein